MNASGDAEHDAPVVDSAVLDKLDRDECLTLVRTVPIGRVAVGVAGQAPLVMPVNFVLDGDVVVFRSDDGDKLRGLQKWPITFQVDAFDPYHQTGWSVMIHGVAEDATDERVGRLTVRPWAPGPKPTWVQIRGSRITGRRLRLVDVPRDGRGYL